MRSDYMEISAGAAEARNEIQKRQSPSKVWPSFNRGIDAGDGTRLTTSISRKRCANSSEGVRGVDAEETVGDGGLIRTDPSKTKLVVDSEHS